ncbi:MAG TPA: hypothetical protein VMV05_02715 [bacterium]|nr:hypothetical protein [bacterium]
MKNTLRHFLFPFALFLILLAFGTAWAVEADKSQGDRANLEYAQKILPILKNSCFDCHSPGAMDQVKVKDPVRRKKIQGILKKAHFQYPMEETFPSAGDEDPADSLGHFIKSIQKGVMPPAKGRKLYGLGKPLSDPDKKILLAWARRNMLAFKDSSAQDQTTIISGASGVEEGKRVLAGPDGSDTADMGESDFRVQIHLFGDMDYEFLGTSDKFPVQNDFLLGRTAIAFTGTYGDQIKFLDQNIVEFSGLDPALELDRLLATYVFSPQFQLSAGRDHAAFGFWNRHFGYVGFLQTTIESPFFLRFEDDGGVIPVHISGLIAEGTFPIGDSSLGYELNAGNSSYVILTGDGSGNVEEAEFDTHAGGGTNRKVFAGRLVFKPAADGSFSLGVATAFNRYATDTSSDTALMGTPVDFRDLGQILLEGELVFRDEHLEILGEFYNFNDRVAGMETQGSPNNTAFYAQLAYELLEDFRPYFRVENLTPDASDPLFQALNQKTQTQYLGGVRWDIIPTVSCLKMEFRYIHLDAGDSMELDTQWAFGF